MLDSQSGLYYFHARYYAPAIGRFLSVDPAQDGDNWWVYCGNKPLVHMDLYGLFAVPNSVQMNFYYASATVKPGKLFNPAYFAQLAESFGPQTIHGSPYGLPRGLDRVQQVEGFLKVGEDLDLHSCRFGFSC
jgi:hypothetical protein